ncbi:sulfite exporter TauE/SafE family protein [Vibrio agarivorans]|uniref:Probable membrane transporter protein n=1 Tax=Vibrio agarivorans TaxID=153622 RepID=A0ABT7Y3V4_9VIBR|nr:sulfite exporter TauE/SafE family protein [Vibrio agarivorans]MDN2482729.1 sulfite exporter TauE/SafE family protein [Vibrio agarivorans]
MILEWILLFLAGFAGGILNSIAGGGSFITFPALMMAGVPPIQANATNTYASCAGYISGAVGFRQDIAQNSRQLTFTIIGSLIGGALGAYLLLTVDEQQFLTAIPWLLLFATLLFIFGAKITQLLGQLTGSNKSSAVWSSGLIGLCLIGVSAYGGFFNAGLGVIVLSYLVIAGYSDINQMNGLKLLISSCVSLIAIVIFVYEGAIDWQRGSVVMVGTLLGGYCAARISRNIKQSYVKNFVALFSIALTVYFFYDVYI